MATPRLTTHRLPGYLGEILLDVRTGDARGARPAVLVVHGFKGFKDWGMFPPLAERLARAGFSAVSFNLSGSGVDETGEFAHLDRFAHATFTGDGQDLTRVIEALAGGNYRVKGDNGMEFLAKIGGRMRRYHIRVIPGDRVTIAVSPYDPTHGLIVFRGG